MTLSFCYDTGGGVVVDNALKPDKIYLANWSVVRGRGSVRLQNLRITRSKKEYFMHV